MKRLLCMVLRSPGWVQTQRRAACLGAARRKRAVWTELDEEAGDRRAEGREHDRLAVDASLLG